MCGSPGTGRGGPRTARMSGFPAGGSCPPTRATPGSPVTGRAAAAVTSGWRATGGEARDLHVSGLLVETGRVVPQELALGVRREAGPLQDVVDGIGELTLRVGIIGGVHQDVVTQDAADVI